MDGAEHQLRGNPANDALFEGLRSLKILQCGDLHSSEAGFAWLCSQAAELQPDLLVFVGDFVTGGPPDYVRYVLAILRDLAPQCFAIPGNWDPRESLVALSEEAYDGLRCLHKSGGYAGGYSFAGLGGSIPTPHGGSPFEAPADDEVFANPLRPYLPADIWLLHNPVYGFRDKLDSGVNVGSEALLELFKEQETAPLLVMSGHIHEADGIDTWRGTTFVNAGPLSSKQLAWIELNGNEVKAELIRAD
jgi:Icc-related predicted phosphoesterase